MLTQAYAMYKLRN